MNLAKKTHIAIFGELEQGYELCTENVIRTPGITKEQTVMKRDKHFGIIMTLKSLIDSQEKRISELEKKILNNK